VIIGRITIIFYNETIKGVVKMEGNHPNEVTFVISRNIKPGYEKDYDDWLRRYLEIERKAPGYLGTTIIIPGGTNSAVRYIIVRYTDKTSMQEWLNSQQSLKLLEEVNNYSIPHYHSATGMETWFTLPDSKSVVAPPRWKMAIVVFIAAYIISSSSRSILNPFLESWPLLAASIIYSAILVAGLTYFALPMLSKLLRRWLYPRSADIGS
jgi:antibiotic biosynthesis monooxygenase (ABM) superfamily enzyme